MSTFVGHAHGIAGTQQADCRPNLSSGLLHDLVLDPCLDTPRGRGITLLQLVQKKQVPDTDYVVSQLDFGAPGRREARSSERELSEKQVRVEAGNKSAQ